MVNVDKRSIVLELQLENKKMVRHDHNSRLTAIFLQSKKEISPNFFHDQNHILVSCFKDINYILRVSLNGVTKCIPIFKG
ncbi:UNVERIFIED_ORG: hypothetical protein ABRZ91_000648 [Heyndrickxia coagulans]